MLGFLVGLVVGMASSDDGEEDDSCAREKREASRFVEPTEIGADTSCPNPDHVRECRSTSLEYKKWV